jgi:DNA-binding XRE family transcriptional regulator
MSSWDELCAEIETEAEAEGPAAVYDLRAKEVKYSLISSLIAGRRDLHLTQAQLAARAGVAQEEISRIERGRKSPTIDTCQWPAEFPTRGHENSPLTAGG